MATRMMTRTCAESSRQPHAVDALIDVCTDPYDDGEDHGPRDACVEIKFQAPDAVDALSS